MPIEIRELQIKVSVNQPQQGGNEGSTAPTTTSATDAQSPREKLVADAVEQVLDLLRKKNER